MAAEERTVKQELITATECERNKTPRNKLDTLPRVRSEMGRVYRRIRAGTMDPGEGRGLIWVLNQIRQVIEAEQKFKILGAGGMADDETDTPVSLPATARLLEDLIRRAEARLPATPGED